MPPGPDMNGSTTPRVEATATVASNALPPAWRIASPAWDASGWAEATIPLGLMATGLLGGGYSDHLNKLRLRSRDEDGYKLEAATQDVKRFGPMMGGPGSLGPDARQDDRHLLDGHSRVE